MSIVNEIPLLTSEIEDKPQGIKKGKLLEKREIFRNKDSIYIRLGSWKGRSLPSQRSIVMFDRTNDHIGIEISQVAFCYQQSRILVNARKSELAN